MKRKLVLATGILVTVACTMSGTYAYYQDSVTVSNHISCLLYTSPSPRDA